MEYVRWRDLFRGGKRPPLVSVAFEILASFIPGRGSFAPFIRFKRCYFARGRGEKIISPRLAKKRKMMQSRRSINGLRVKPRSIKMKDAEIRKQWVERIKVRLSSPAPISPCGSGQTKRLLLRFLLRFLLAWHAVNATGNEITAGYKRRALPF